MIDQLKQFASKYDTLIVFVISELLALVAFGLGNGGVIYRYLSIVSVLLVVPFIILGCKKKEISSLFLYLIPFFVLVVLLAFSKFSLNQYNAVYFISLLIGLPCFFLTGFGLSKIKAAKGPIILLVIGSSLALVLVISLLYSMVRYGPFYAGIYSNKYYYYNGEIYPVFLEAKWLLGFSFDEVSLSFFGVFSVILTCPLFALLFISIKKNRKIFFICLGFGLLGLISIVFIPNKEAALFLIPAFIFALLYRFYPKDNKSLKIGKIIFFIILGILSLGFIVFFLNAAGVSFLNSWTSSNEFLNKVFNTSSYTKPYHDAIYLFTRPEFLFGVNPNEISAIKTKYGVDVSYPYTSSILLDAGLEAGIFGFIAFIVFVVFASISIYKYLKNSHEQKYVKFLFVSFLLSYFIYSLFRYDETPRVHSQYFESAFYSLIILVVLFVLGFIYTPIFEKNMQKSDKSSENEQFLKEEKNNE